MAFRIEAKQSEFFLLTCKLLLGIFGKMVLRILGEMHFHQWGVGTISLHFQMLSQRSDEL